MKTKRYLLLFIALVMILSLFSGCQDSKPSQVSPPNSTGDKPSDLSEEQSGSEKTLKILAWDLGADNALPIGDNYWTEWIQSEFGDPNNIRLEWVSMPRWEEVTTLNVWMAGHDAPDIVFTYDINVVINYIIQGGVTNLTSAMDKYGKELKTFLGDEVLEYGVFDGEQMVIPAIRPLPAIVGSSIRGDWLESVGMDVPETTEEWYNVMHAFKEQDPGNLGDLNIPCGMGMQEVSFGYFNMLYSFVNPKLTMKDLTLTYPFEYDGYKEGVAFLNKCYNEGLISPEFALDSDCSKMISDISNGYVGFFTQNVLLGFGNNGAFNTMAENVEGSYYLACDPFTNSEGKRPKLSNQPYGRFIMVPTFSEVADEAVMYMNWLANPENLKMLQLGVEGKHHTFEDGVYTYNSNYDGEDRHSAYNNYEYTIILEGVYYGEREAAIKNATASLNNEQADIQYQMALTDIRQDPWFFPYFKKPVISEGKYATTMQDKYKEMFTQLIMCEPDSFSSLYDSLVDEFMTMYGNEVCAERAQVWDATME